MKVDDVVGDIPPRRFDRVTAEVKEVAVLLFVSCATILMLKGTPTDWVVILVPEAFVTTK